MKIITLNANGIRAAHRKGFFEWFSQQDADVVCIQETKAQLDQLPPKDFIPQGYHFFQADAVKKGYSGVAIYSKHQPISVEYGLGWDEFDSEGRWLAIDLGELIIASLYLPSGSSKDSRQDFKYVCMERIEQKLHNLLELDKPFVVCGDWNIAHRKIDIKNWRGNLKNSGFLPEEREWMSHLFDNMDLLDAFRHVEPAEHQYSWWSNRGQAWANNTGWRLDYHITSAHFKEKVKAATIYKDQRFSDHAPVILDYDL